MPIRKQDSLIFISRIKTLLKEIGKEFGIDNIYVSNFALEEIDRAMKDLIDKIISFLFTVDRPTREKISKIFLKTREIIQNYV